MGEGGVGGVFKGGENIFFLTFDDALHGFEVAARELVWESEEGLVLGVGLGLAGLFRDGGG